METEYRLIDLSNWNTIGSFFTYDEALREKSKYEEEGIKCAIKIFEYE